jgi:hypothetical protein
MSNEPKKYLAEFISKEEKTFGDVEKYVITHKQPNSQEPAKERKYGAIVADLSDEAVLLIDGASAGERYCLHIVTGEDKYPLIVDVTDAKDAPAKYEGKAKYNNNKQYQPRDDTGIAVGAAWTNAIELYKLVSDEDKFNTIDDAIEHIEQAVSKILKSKLAQEAKLRADKAKTTGAQAATKEEEPKKLSRAERIKAKKAAEATKPKPAKKVEVEEPVVEDYEELEDDDLDDVKFDEE